ncbi:FtsK/SpoIIIE family DNA translocase [Tenacibaculum agarivorans]|uniref:FtsK/SpoIIIE family DNA translocase n=1 Tax=Tenacibaculum agarivorans TaxID=1908389 RepID=UPI00094B8EF4|nr:DNA translocase FtsK [Tenacibaculum agarivorans]
MAKKTASKKTKKVEKTPTFNQVSEFFKNRQTQTIIGVFLVLFALFLFVAFISFFFSWEEDHSIIGEFQNKQLKAKNLLGKIGSSLSHVLVYNGFGLASFILPFLILLTGISFLLQTRIQSMVSRWNWGLFNMLWVSIALGFVDQKFALLSGTIGYELNDFLSAFIGRTGLAIVLIFFLLSYIVVRFKITPESIGELLKRRQENRQERAAKAEAEKSESTPETPNNQIQNNENEIGSEAKSDFELSVKNLEPTISNHSSISKEDNNINLEVTSTPITVNDSYAATQNKGTDISDSKTEVEIAIEKVAEEKSVTQNLSDQLVQDFGEFDPTLELGQYKFPTFNLLKEYNESISIDPNELEANKNQIVETLKNYKIGIAQIKATVGPTITLYEIVPEAGVRISKIKNLEDDIALSLSALGIRIIAPIPGKGTIGIEVPNKKATIVSMHSVITSKKFQESPMELPLALGKTISNETLVVDLAKMPHLLMAGATGQGKSVGLNAILTSLLYRKHPAEVKFVLVDPKKVELTLFNKIERHYLAKLPDSEEAIITDTSKVVNTLNSLCIEMDNRYDLLKNAMVRNIKEYNAKFKARKLNPENGHQFLPYIVLVIDEFADLIMTAGKEVETPIARLAQLARAIGIHLIVATQRPSVNVITGIIKANFPSRIAFRVTSKIDSRTILDAPGADQLIGRGDMLYSGGNDITRIQCAFVDTPEVEKITDFIGSQRAYPEAHLLPEYVGEEGGTTIDNNIADRDKLFKEAAEVIVTAQQGSASLLQRKLKLGYNRAGRLIDQLEAAGIVGPFEGSKARQVLVPDLIALEQLLENEQN